MLISEAGDTVRHELSGAIYTVAFLDSDGKRATFVEAPKSGFFLLEYYTLVRKGKPLPVTLIPGDKYTHPRWTKTEDRKFFTLCYIHKDGRATIEYDDSTIFSLTKREVAEIKPYHEPIKHVRYINFYKDRVSGAPKCSRYEADLHQEPGNTRIGCKRVEFIEGEFDD